MQSLTSINNQLSTLRSRLLPIVAWREVKQLPNILWDDEALLSALIGRTTNALALLIATDKRIILIDKKLFSVKVDDIPYSRISSIEHSAGLFTGSIKIFFRGSTIEFKQVPLSQLLHFAQTTECRIGMPEEQPVGHLSNYGLRELPYTPVLPPRPMIHTIRKNS